LFVPAYSEEWFFDLLKQREGEKEEREYEEVGIEGGRDCCRVQTKGEKRVKDPIENAACLPSSLLPSLPLSLQQMVS